MIKFIKVFRDAKKKGPDGMAKKYLPTQVAKFSPPRENQIVKLGFAVKLDAKKGEFKPDEAKDEK